MIHYHGTRFSGDVATTIRALQGKHAFVSFADKGDMEIIAEVCQSFALDNGAFSAWKSGKPLDVEGYAGWVEAFLRHPGMDFYCIPDDIEGGFESNRKMIALWQNIVPHNMLIHGAPVWHLDEPLEALRDYCNAFQRVAFGSSAQYSVVGSPTWWSRMAEAMEYACDEHGRPKAKLHGLRMLDPTVFSHLPFSSADSTNVARNIGMDSAWKGPYAPKSRETRALILMERIEAHCSASRWCNSSAGVQQNFELFG